MIRVAAAYRYLEKDLSDYLRLFDENTDRDVEVEICCDPLEISVNGERTRYPEILLTGTALQKRRKIKRAAMASVYRYLQSRTGKRVPYGAFTGIRPTKQYVQVEREGLDPDRYFLDFLDCSPEKVALVSDIVRVQKPVFVQDPDFVDLYVGIPFCRGRCSYCSFISCNLNEREDLETPYVDALIRELEGARALYEEKKIRSVYIGGGTPSAISRANIRRILKALESLRPPEFTFEAGRPDSIDRELLDLCAEYGVTRMSVNPQSANDETLQKIGRRHTFAQVEEAYRLVRQYPFDVNMDVIMGLADERAKDFAYTLDRVLSLRPENITVHALSLKKGSVLKESGAVNRVEDAEEMSRLAYSRMKSAGYDPYYLYRQKYSAGHLENTGYARNGHLCVYNMDNMEEWASVLAFGANSISKRVYCGEERIERQANPKDIPTYIQKIPLILEEKFHVFKEEA